ncbi:chemotaxis-specific protein-glutamate methyltransferase CheB [Roseomonas soli]|uniref:Protein-glutamate methylesterase/protein-glutamine glutaminase n=2 Tax=Neoroseomonas soli TaxID=1081025 RepID=A0A9X9WVU5_9PROT|nr:chemotaxis-specific protein-glutamate methyltransferase CheB [Neoroseomonas soli]
MLCDDSATTRAILARILDGEPGIRVVHRAGDGRAALDALPVVRPDVVLLDLEMPVMDGMTALPLILKAAPRTAVIVASALTQRGARAAIAALAAGASDYVPKPQGAAGGAADPGFRAELVAKVRGWARMKRQDPASVARRVVPPPPSRAVPAGPRLRPALVAIGSSTGGPQALATLVRRLPRLPVPVVLAQHMPAGFTTMLAEHLDRLGPNRCAEATDGEPLVAGRIHVAPGDRHLLVEATAAGLRARLTTDPPENFCRPAVDPMLRSAARACGGKVLAVILTGMGHDGLEGCRAVAAAGGTVLAQDEASSVVWGMPGAVARAGLPALLAPPEALAERIAALAAERITV